MKAATTINARDRQEPVIGEAPLGHLPRSAEMVQAVCTEVYRLTGKTLTDDDPILIAALFQSELVRRASQEMAHRLEQTTSQQITQLTEAFAQGRSQAGQLDQVIAQAFQHIAEGARKVSDAELSELQARFARIAAATMEQIRRQSLQGRPASVRWKFAVCVSTGILLGLIAGTWMGSHLAPKLTAEQVRLMANGMLLDDAWPRLPRSSRELFELGGKAEVSAPAPAAVSAKRSK